MKTLLLAAASVFAMAGAAHAQSAEEWRASAQQDLQAMHDLLRDNHPALVVGGGDARFASELEAGLTEARGRIGEVRDVLDYGYLLRGYARRMGDTNVWFEGNWQQGPLWDGVAWTNFTVGWRNGGYEVTWVKDGVRNLPPLGARLVSCDGVAAEDFARRRLDGWEGDLDIEGDRVMSAPYLFWDRGNPFIGGLPGECEFTVGRRGRDFRITSGFATEAERRAAWVATIYTPGTSLAVETMAGGHWIHVHDLTQNGSEAFLAQIDSQLDALRGGNVVIDLRGAMNGTPSLGYALANRLWGVDYRIAQQNIAGEIVYRASPANRAYYMDVLSRMQNDAGFAYNYPGAIRRIQDLIVRFDETAAAGQQTFSQTIAPPIPAIEAAEVEGADTETADPAAPPPAPVEAATNPMRGQVIVLVDAGCRNACLDVVDMLVAMPNVRVAGTPTGADSVHFEINRVPLPSGQGFLNYGHKTWLGRTRPSNTPHAPSAGLAYTGNPVDDAAVRTWVQSLFGG